MKIKRVKFLRYFNRPRLIMGIEIDTLFVFMSIFLLVYVALTLTASVNAFLLILLGFGFGSAASFYYEKYKNEAPKSILSHILYIYNIKRIKIGSKKFEKEVKRMDISPEKYFPTPNEKFFME